MPLLEICAGTSPSSAFFIDMCRDEIPHTPEWICEKQIWFLEFIGIRFEYSSDMAASCSRRKQAIRASSGSKAIAYSLFFPLLALTADRLCLDFGPFSFQCCLLYGCHDLTSGLRWYHSCMRRCFNPHGCRFNPYLLQLFFTGAKSVFSQFPNKLTVFAVKP